ncbi:MAG: hypothetical protein GX660_14605 [Clostridiaceae bacterium]|nr:hypothetical protein [Clostridiaceae bacterium]
MQLQRMLLILLMLIIIPIIIISSNDSAFFIILAIILSLASLKSIIENLFISIEDDIDLSDDMIDEIEDQTNLNIYKFGIGLSVIKDLVIILFFVYCNFYLYSFIYKILFTFVTLYWLNDLVSSIKNPDKNNSQLKGIKVRFINVLTNLSSLLIIIIVAYNKFKLF